MGDANAERAGDIQSRHGRYPLTDAQAEKWLSSRYSDAAALAFTEGCELAFDGRLDAEALARAFNRVTARHEALSMRFDDDGSAQIHEPPSAIELQRRDFSAETDPPVAYAGFCTQQASVRFDPARPPLVEAWLCRLAARQWRLLLRAHHLVFDGWSLRIVLQDLAAHYNDIVNSDGDGKLPRTDSWIEYVQVERKRRDGEVGRHSLDYWLERYRDLPEPLRLPTDHPRKPQLGFAAETLEYEVPAALWRHLRTTAREHGVTRFSLLLAGYALLMHRLTGQDDIVCGVPFAGAARGAGARVVGDTGSTLPLRIQVLPDEPLAHFIRRVHTAMREAIEHQDISLGRIVDVLAPRREAGRRLLVESILSLNPAIERLRFHDVDCRLSVTPHTAMAFELAWQWRPLPGRTLLELQYRTDLYHPATARAWCEAYADVLGQMVREGDALIADIGDAAAASGFSLVDERGHGRDADASLPRLLDAAFAEHAGRCAAQCGDREIDYTTLDRASGAAASALRARGVVAGQLVGICMTRSIDMLVAVLAVLRSGAAYVPLAPSFPAQRLHWMADHAGLALIVASELASLPEGLAEGREVLAFATLAADAADVGDVAEPLPEVDGDSLAYVLYTSGSTGEPKGVRILQRNLVNFLCSMRESPGFGRDDAICAVTTLSFDIAALELFLPLLCGGRVVIADDSEHHDPGALARLIARRRCTVLQTTPSLLALLHEVGRDDVLQPLKLLVGGEALPTTLAQKLLPRCRQLWNLYGPTETTVWSSVARLDADSAEVPLGSPVANTRIYLLDSRRKPVLPGAIGEIWIGGAGVADGYLYRPELSAERFVEDPFAADGSRMYRSGDLGRIRDGNLFFHGRIDEQIKLRGYRIEVGEIEAAAMGETDIVECAAIARDAGGGNRELVLYAGSDTDPCALSRRLRVRLESTLPQYMRPHRIVILPKLPKTPNGKLDRRALPMPTVANPAPEDVDASPRNLLERELCHTWQLLLVRDRVGIHDNFFELGGHSLLAVRMFAGLRDRYGVDLPLATLIERPTVAALAEAVDAAADAHEDTKPVQGDVGTGSLVELRPGDSGTPVFLIHAVGGHVLNYLPVARAMPHGRAVYGLQSPGLSDAAASLPTIEAMAEHYAREIRHIRPQGSCVVAGASMGGVIALEVARRLRASGVDVALLALFDTYGPHMSQRLGKSPWRRHGLWAQYRRLDLAQRGWLWRRIGFRLWRLPWMRLRQRLWDAPVPRELRMHLVERSNHLALAGHCTQPYPGRIVLFKATQDGPDDDPTHAWREFAEAVDVIHIDARHDNIIEQPQLAERFRECVEGC